MVIITFPFRVEYAKIIAWKGSIMMNAIQTITPSYDPWEAYLDVEKHGGLTLSNIEFTTTTLCNMRCAHCAVGYTLQTKDPDALPIDLIIKRLDEIPHLKTLSITGGEPMMSKKSVREYVLPLLKYAHSRGVRTQMNSNLTIDGARYLEIAPYLDVLHISHNWGTIEEFVETGFAMMERKPTFDQRAALFQRMIDNSRMLAENGVMVSAETMLNKKTLPYLEHIHHQIVHEMKCARHEVHPMYPSDFASALTSLSLEETRNAIDHLLDVRDENTWMLFGTLPFYPCSMNEEDLRLQKRLKDAKNVTVRNDPDGRSRLNINIFTGEVIVTDFGDAPPLGNITHDSLPAIFDKWLESDLAKSLNCHCPAVKCLGPNVLVKNMYYKDHEFISGSVK
jgi:radical SAM/CxCxxxxC motif protein YfkAB